MLPAAADAQDYSGYVPPSDSLVAEKLEHWQDLKFGVIFHWGLYSIPGIVESWSICSEDVDWINRSRDLGYEEYKQWYWGLKENAEAIYGTRSTACYNDGDIWFTASKDSSTLYAIYAKPDSMPMPC